MIQEKLTYGDVLLVPKFNPMDSRSDVSTGTRLGNHSLRIPLISANMDTITGEHMARVMDDAGGLGILNRYFTVSETITILERFKATPSIGIKEADHIALELYRKYTDSICIDTAHAHTVRAFSMTASAKKLGYNTIIVGNVATAGGAAYLEAAGANVIKVGIGPGSMCTTREKTGCGYPQLSAVMEVRAALGQTTHIIADGGIESSGDIVKALAAGAQAVMIGKLFAGTSECLDRTRYRGMASVGAQRDAGKTGKYIEGDSVKFAQGTNFMSVSTRIEGLMSGVRSGMTYCGASNLAELYANAEFIRVTSSGRGESAVRG